MHNSNSSCLIIHIGPQETDSEDLSKHMNYSTQVYYKLRGRNKWTMKFIVTKNLEAYIAVR